MTLVASSETRGEKVDCGQGTDSNEHSRRIHESVADSEVSGMAEPSQYGDTTTVMILRRASEKRLRNQDDGHEPKPCTRSHGQCCSRL